MNFGVIGRNFVTDRMMEAAALTPGLRCTAVCSRSAAGAQSFAAKYGAAHTFTDIKELAACPEVDFVYIATPHYIHAEQCETLLRAGKHVFCEKTLVPGAARARELFELAREHGLVLMEAMMPVHSPALAAIRSLLPRLGRIRCAELSFCQYSSRYDKFRAGIVENAFRPELCNGAAMDMGIYCAELFSALFGAPDTVTAHSVFLPGGADGATSAVLGCRDGMTAVINCSKITQGGLPSQIQGEDATLLIDFVSHPEKLTLLPRGGEPETVDATPALPVMCYELADMIAAVNTPPSARAARFGEFERMTTDAVSLLERIRQSAGIDFTAK